MYLYPRSVIWSPCYKIHANVLGNTQRRHLKNVADGVYLSIGHLQEDLLNRFEMTLLEKRKNESEIILLDVLRTNVLWIMEWFILLHIKLVNAVMRQLKEAVIKGGGLGVAAAAPAFYSHCSGLKTQSGNFFSDYPSHGWLSSSFFEGGRGITSCPWRYHPAHPLWG